MKIGGLIKHSFCDYPEKIAAVIFTNGCNFNCPYCHNKKLITLDNNINNLTESFIFNFLDSRKDQLDGIVVSGGEPLIQQKIIPFISKIKGMGFDVKLDTNGSKPLILKEIIDLKIVNYIAMDIKAPFYKYSKLSGVKVEISNIKQSIELISNSGIKHHFRTTKYIKMLNDKNILEIKKTIPINSKHIEQKYIEL